jgi:hypothetical protein
MKDHEKCAEMIREFNEKSSLSDTPAFKISRAWAMPNRETFKIKPIKNLIEKYLDSEDPRFGIIIDPFVRNSIFKRFCDLTNDINPDIKASHNLEAKDFMNLVRKNSVSLMLFDPPYSPRQLKECYQDMGRSVMQADTQSSFYSHVKNSAKDAIKPGGIVISFGWNSGGMGKTRGFEIIEILMVCHGGNINDTICTVERKIA